MKTGECRCQQAEQTLQIYQPKMVHLTHLYSQTLLSATNCLNNTAQLTRTNPNVRKITASFEGTTKSKAGGARQALVATRSKRQKKAGPTSQMPSGRQLVPHSSQTPLAIQEAAVRGMLTASAVRSSKQESLQLRRRSVGVQSSRCGSY